MEINARFTSFDSKFERLLSALSVASTCTNVNDCHRIAALEVRADQMKLPLILRARQIWVLICPEMLTM